MRGRIQIVLSVAVFLGGLTVLFGRVLLDFEEYVTELESRAFERAVAGDVPARPPTLAAYEARSTAAVLLAARVDVADAGLIWAAWDLEGDEDGSAFRADVERLAQEDGWIAPAVVWLNESRIDGLREIRLEEALVRANPKLEALSPNQLLVVQTLWQQHGEALLSGLVDIANRVAQARGEQILQDMEDRVRNSLRAEFLPAEQDMREWVDLRADETHCVLTYAPSPDYYEAELTADCPGGDEVTRTITLPRFE